MGFASAYLEERALFLQKIIEAPDRKTGIIVVVPSYNEPGITRMLDSLAECTEPECKTEVIIVINAPADASAESIENNILTLKNIESWKKENKNSFFRLFAFIVEESPVKGWGVGLARKTGMDEAIRRFNSIDRPEGVILNLDADCTVEQNYFIEVQNELLTKNDRAACSIYFEHPLVGKDYPKAIYRYITFYELHLRYYFQGLAFSGFPYVFHTVGSAIAVKALSYIKAGGMNRKQAGEDFYFIQKLVPAGGYFNLNSTVVYPSPRASSRVPFGTGASIGKLNTGESSSLLTYNFMAFYELRTYFGNIGNYYKSSPEELINQYRLIPTGLRSFMNEEEWVEKLMEIKNNTSDIQAFKKRFFGWFNMFRIVKYLNFVHTRIFEKRPVEVSATELLKAIGIDFESKEPHDLLLYYRKLEKKE
jgi:hypothetical protein